MIISKDLFIFGEHIFATIIPEVGLSLQQPAQQIQTHQEQQLQQQQRQEIGASSLVDVAKTASILVVSEKVISGQKIPSTTTPTTNTTTTEGAVSGGTATTTTTISGKPLNKQETVAVVIAAATVATSIPPPPATPTKIIKNNNNKKKKTSLNNTLNKLSCKEAVNWELDIRENNLQEQENQRNIELYNNSNNNINILKIKSKEPIVDNEAIINIEDKDNKILILNKVKQEIADEVDEFPSFHKGEEDTLYKDVTDQEENDEDEVFEEEIIEQQPLVQKLLIKLNKVAVLQPQYDKTTCRQDIEVEERANTVSEVKASATPSPSVITTGNINDLVSTEVTSATQTPNNLNCEDLLSNMGKVMLGNNARNDQNMANLPFISKNSEQDSQQQQHTIQLTFQNINFCHGDRKILSDISGIVNPGEVLAIMGPSGSGKTTLLDCLCGQRRPETGSIFLNREPLSKKWRRKICYVLQEEIFFAGLTLRETVMYTAMLRLPEKMHKRDKIKQVDRILKELELNSCEGTKFGDYLNRGLSGGEKKRANIACELLTNPLLMLLDEPTSGLDSHSAISLMRVLKRYAAQERKTVVITVHQPSSQMFHMFDKLLLLYNGRTAYFGEVKNIYQYFEDVGFAIKPHYNPADFLLEQLKSFPDVREKLFVAAKESYYNFLDRNCIAAKTNANNNLQHKKTDIHGNAAIVENNNNNNNSNNKKTTHKHDVLINDIINNYYNDIQSNQHHHHHHHINNDTVLIMDNSLHNHTCTVGDAADQQLWCGSESNFSSSSGGTARWVDDNDVTDDWLDYPTHFSTQLCVLTSRSFKEAKPRMLSKLNWFQTIGLALMAGAIWFNLPRTEEYLHDLQGWMFFSQTYWMLFALFGALNSFPSEREVISKERRSGAYRLSAYYLAKMFAELPLVITLPTVYLIISYPMLGCTSAKLFFLMLVFLLLNTIVAQSVGFFIGAYCMDMNVSITLSALYTLATQLFGGYLSSRIPEGLSWIRFTSMIHYAYQNMQILEFREGPKISCGIPSSYDVCKNNSTKFIPYDEILKAQNSNSPLWLNTLILMMFFLIFRGLGYAVLRFIRCPKAT